MIPPDATREAVAQALAELRTATGALEATYWRIAPEGAHLEAFATSGASAGLLPGLRVPSDTSIVGLVAASGMPTCVGPDADYHPAADARTGLRTEAMAAAPVAQEGTPVGVVSAINPQGRARFDGRDLAHLQEAADRIAAALRG